MINLTMMIHIATLTTVCLLTSCEVAFNFALRKRCNTQAILLQQHPLHILTFILEHRIGYIQSWVNSIRWQVSGLENRTGIGRRWALDQPGLKDRKVLGAKELTELLHNLLTAGADIRLGLEAVRRAVELGVEFRALMERLESLRKEAGCEVAKKSVRTAWEDQIEFNEMVVATKRANFSELLDRVQAQIDVVSFLIKIACTIPL
jgi:hypothetical protein